MKTNLFYSLCFVFAILVLSSCGKKSPATEVEVKQEEVVAVPEGLEWAQGDWTVGYAHIRIIGDKVYRSDEYIEQDKCDADHIKKALDAASANKAYSLVLNPPDVDYIVKGLKLNSSKDVVCDEYQVYVIDKKNNKIYLHEGKDDDSFDGWAWDPFRKTSISEADVNTQADWQNGFWVNLESGNEFLFIDDNQIKYLFSDKGIAKSSVEKLFKQASKKDIAVVTVQPKSIQETKTTSGFLNYCISDYLDSQRNLYIILGEKVDANETETIYLSNAKDKKIVRLHLHAETPHVSSFTKLN